MFIIVVLNFIKSIITMKNKNLILLLTLCVMTVLISCGRGGHKNEPPKKLKSQAVPKWK